MQVVGTLKELNNFLKDIKQMNEKCHKLIADAMETDEDERGINIGYRITEDDRVYVFYANALSYSDLPEEYVRDNPSVCKIDGVNMLRLFTKDGKFYNVAPGSCYSRETFAKIVSTCYQAGERLRQINKRQPKLLKI